MQIEQTLLQAVYQIARQAGEKILSYYQQTYTIQAKTDSSPVTEADLAAHHVILQGLQALTPGIPVLSEEGDIPSFNQRQAWSEYWLVDPLDGTKGFIQKNGEFTINIALIRGHRPVIGIIYVPVKQYGYLAGVGLGTYKVAADQTFQPIKTRSCQLVQFTILTSRHHGNEKLANWLQRFGKFQQIQYNSAIKFGLLAEGIADFYPRLAPTSEWDSAAGQCIVEQAGGAVMELSFKPLQYNAKDSLQNPSFIVVGDVTFPWQEYLINLS